MAQFNTKSKFFSGRGIQNIIEFAGEFRQIKRFLNITVAALLHEAFRLPV
jgi:hypothetical protein